MPILTWNEDTNEAEEIAGVGVSTGGEIGDISGETIPATLNSSSPYAEMTVNEYADKAPGAWVGTESEFQSIAPIMKNNGTYFILEN